MLKSSKFYFIIAIIAVIAMALLSQTKRNHKQLPVIAIANYGPHPSLFETIEGIQEQLAKDGYVDGKNIKLLISDVNYDTSIIIQMLSRLKASTPKVLIALSTPVAQSAKNIIKDIPVVFADVTDPVKAGLSVKQGSNVTGASDMQDTKLMFMLAKEILPQAEKVGVLYSTGEANDKALVDMLTESAKAYDIEVIALPVEHSREVVTRIKSLASKVDFIYAGSSSAIQVSIPAISAAADEAKIPLFSFNSNEVINHQALASYGVSHKSVGINAAKIVKRILEGVAPDQIAIIYPSKEDHKPYVSMRKLEQLGLKLPKNLEKKIEHIHIQEYTSDIQTSDI